VADVFVRGVDSAVLDGRVVRRQSVMRKACSGTQADTDVRVTLIVVQHRRQLFRLLHYNIHTFTDYRHALNGHALAQC